MDDGEEEMDPGLAEAYCTADRAQLPQRIKAAHPMLSLIANMPSNGFKKGGVTDIDDDEDDGLISTEHFIMSLGLHDG